MALARPEEPTRKRLFRHSTGVTWRPLIGDPIAALDVTMRRSVARTVRAEGFPTYFRRRECRA